MRRRDRLTLELCPRQAQRFELADAFRVHGWLRPRAATPLGFPFFDLFLDARIGVNQAFSGITHSRCRFLKSGREVTDESLILQSSPWCHKFQSGRIRLSVIIRVP
jgi:hypothetical protein